MGSMMSEHMSVPTLPNLLTLEQIAEHLQVSVKTVRRWIDAGDLVVHRFGRGLRVSEDDLQVFIRMRRGT